MIFGNFSFFKVSAAILVYIQIERHALLLSKHDSWYMKCISLAGFVHESRESRSILDESEGT